jgi:hypothetical protein
MFVLRRLAVAGVVLAWTLWAGPPLTTIQDVIYKADGTRFSGVVVINWNTFESADSSRIGTQSLTLRIVDGNMRVQLVPTTNADPISYYSVKYSSDGKAQSEETWAVPPSAIPLRIRDVRVTVPPAPIQQVRESDVLGLVADLSARPIKGPGYAPSRAAFINSGGALEGVTGSYSDCVRADGTAGPCGSGIGSFNGQTNTSQSLSTSSACADFTISSSGGVHTFCLPNASSSARGLLTIADWGRFDSGATAANAATSLNTPGTIVRRDGSGNFSAGTVTGNVTGRASTTESDLASAADPAKGAGLVGFKRSETGAAGRTVADKLREFISVKDFGAVGNWVTNDTAAIQAAINALGANGGTLLFDGNFVTGPLTFPNVSSGNWLILKVKGSLNLLGTLTLPDWVALIGESAAVTSQLANTPAAYITPPPGTAPAIRVVGGGAHYIANINVQYCDGPCILVDGTGAAGGANLKMDNVYLEAHDTSSVSVPLRIDDFFWVWANNCVFLSAPNAYHASVHITNSVPATAGGASGLIYLHDSRIAAHGIRIDSSVTANQLGNLYIDGLTYENGRSSLLMIDSTNGIASGIELNRVEVADSVSVPYVIESLVVPPPRQIRNIAIRNSWGGIANKTISNVSIYGLVVEGAPATDASLDGWSPGPQKNFTITRGGITDTEWAGNGHSLGPSIVPYQTLGVQQDPAKWTIAYGVYGAGVVTTGITAPDGSPTAGKITMASGIDGKQPYRVSRTLAAGDWILAGVWARSEDAAKPVSPHSLVSFTDSNARFDNSAANYFSLVNEMAFRSGGAWVSLTALGKVTTGGTGELILGLYVDNVHPTSFWMPWMIRVPAGAMPDAEVIRLARFLRNFPAAMPGGGGILAMYPHQKLYWGNDTNLYRSSDGALATDSKVDFGGAAATAPFKIGTIGNRPATCSAGQAYFATDEAAGSNLSLCTAANVWTPISGGGSGNPDAVLGKSSLTTIGRVTKVTASGVIGQSVLQDDGTFVGVGIVPTDRFHINTSGNLALKVESGDNANFNFIKGASANYGTISFYTGAARTHYLSSFNDNTFRITRDNNTDLVFSGNGNILLGTAVDNAAGKLQVAGGIAPEADGTRDVGAGNFKWRNGYFSGAVTTQSVQLTGGARPACDDSQRGKFWFTGGGSGKDSVEVCARDSSGADAWRVIY